jgi:hypothetical protein
VDGVDYQRQVYALYIPDDDGDGQNAPVAITVDGTPTTAYFLDRDRGTVLFDDPMTGGEVLRWTGSFSLWVRFQSDRLPFSIDNKSADVFVVNGSVDLLEMPPPALEESA